MPQPALPFLESTVSAFPDTRYMGSKRRLVPFLREHLRGLKCDRVLDAFSGTACVAYLCKQLGAEVTANDFLKFCAHIARATVENNDTQLTDADIYRLLQANPAARTFIRDTFAGLFFDEADCEFLDHLWPNIQQMEHPLKRALALAAACRACMKKRPRGLFTFTCKTGQDGRRDLRLTLRDQFLEAVAAYNACVFSNHRQNRTFCSDVFELPPDAADLVYLDPPYLSRFSDSDYTRRYHFVEGFCSYWQGVEIMTETKTKKIRSYPTAFARKAGGKEAFARLFHHFRQATLVLSYSSNGIPTRDEIVDLLKEFKRTVAVHEIDFRYHHGNRATNGEANNSNATEYLFIAS